MKPFTIKTFFPTGDPSGLRVAFVRGLPVKAFYIPRSDVKIFKKHYKKYASLEGMYMLFNTNNPNDINQKKDVYIGKTTNIINRLRSHSNRDDKEDWWNVELAFTITDSTDPLDEGATSYLEYLMCRKAANSTLFKLRYNQQHPKKQSISESDEDHDKALFHNINLLSKALGFDVFLNVNQNAYHYNNRSHNIFVINRRDSYAKAKYTPKGLVILKGSKITPHPVLKNFHDNHYKDWPINQEGIFTENKLCVTPSEGSSIIIKGPSDGWIEWHRPGNRNATLGSYYR